MEEEELEEKEEEVEEKEEEVETPGASLLNISVSGGKILPGKPGLAWSDGSPTDFLLWPEEEQEEQGEERRKPGLAGCVALFADLVFQHTRQAEHGEILWKA